MIRLDRLAADQLHRTFLEAFADYAMDASGTTEAALQLRGDKNGVDPELSVGAFAGDRMIGFTLVGVGPWEGRTAAFDAGTGIVKEHRGGGLAKEMFEFILPALRERGVELFLLEVLKENDAAIRAYEKAGFRRTRELTCLRLSGDDFPAADPPSGVAIRPVDKGTVLGLADQADWTPSWENSFSAIERIPEDLILLGAFSGEQCIGTIAFSPHFHWILNLLVSRENRRSGIATALIAALCDALPAESQEVRITNVDSGDDGMLACLANAGFTHWVDQYEMALPIE